MPTRERYFVTVETQSQGAFVNLSEFEMDLFGPISKAPSKFTTEGLLDMKEIELLVMAGYRVTVHEEASKRARAATQITTLPDWIKAMEG